jgi:hypothetical protein
VVALDHLSPLGQVRWKHLHKFVDQFDWNFRVLEPVDDVDWAASCLNHPSTKQAIVFPGVLGLFYFIL